jgi:hypothetical protein
MISQAEQAAERGRSTGTIPYSQTHLCIPKQPVPTRIWTDLGGAHLRAPVLSTEERKSICVTCCGPQRRSKQENWEGTHSLLGGLSSQHASRDHCLSELASLGNPDE